jgi:hypothetical protein
MQFHARIKYPRTIPEANRIISYLDRLFLNIVASSRGRQRSRNFIRLIQITNELNTNSEKKTEDSKKENDKKFHKIFNEMIMDWAKKRRLPIK